MYKTYKDAETNQFDDERNQEYMIKQTQCKLCLRYFQQEESLMKIPICDHIFHIHCLRKWLIDWQKCPTCEQNIIHLPEATRKKYLNSIDKEVSVQEGEWPAAILSADESRDL